MVTMRACIPQGVQEAARLFEDPGRQHQHLFWYLKVVPFILQQSLLERQAVRFPVLVRIVAVAVP